MKVALIIAFGLAVAIAGVLAGMIAFGTSDPPAPLASISNPFEKVDFSDLPAIQTIPARQGSPIAFRQWPATDAQGSEPIVIAIHGSSASSHSIHPLGKALSAKGLTVYAPDMRGHGKTGRRGDADYAQQLDDDIGDFVSAIKARHPNARLALLGFSSGGGFALHVAGSPLGAEFERVVLLSPMLGPRTPTVKFTGDAWAKPFIPRIIALVALNRIGIHAFDYLPVLAFAIPPARADILTGRYSFRLMRAFGTKDYAADLKNASVPILVLVGEKDELFSAELFAPTMRAVKPNIPVSVIPDLKHIDMTTDPRAVPAIMAALGTE